ncbi:FG-GAP-like repeat-containing protein [Nonomuraea sp. NPDC050404]|uniref:FG-GAP-like repeat-containing protein n=1 Tax=Nonomuraea sp. NPDC050404 TaxID=3155783 RepID=UPI0033F5DB54
MVHIVGMSLVATLLAVGPVAAPPVAAAGAADRRTASWNMDGRADGTDGSSESRWSSTVPRMLGSLSNDGDAVEVLSLQEAGNYPHTAAEQTGQQFAGGEVTEFRWNLGTATRRDEVYIYWVNPGQQRNGLAIVTREQARDAAWMVVGGRIDSRVMFGVQVGDEWYFNAHAASMGADTTRNNAEDILETARQFMAHRSPLAEYMVLADFNRNPSLMPDNVEGHIIRTNQPTFRSGNEPDWAFASNETMETMRAERRGYPSNHNPVLFIRQGGCRPVPAAQRAADDGECNAPVPGRSYRFWLAADGEADRILINGGAGFGDFPRLSSYAGWEEDEEVRIHFGWRSGTYQLKLGGECIGRTSNDLYASVVFTSCDVKNQKSEWSISDGKLLNPDAGEPMTAGPRRGATGRFWDMEMRKESYTWRFEDVKGDAGPVDPDDPGPVDPDNPGPVKPDVRLMAVGDSITYGVGSSDDNGYRKMLWDALDREGFHPDFVGSSSSGDMSDPQHDGNRGWVIDQIAGPAAADAVSMRPNVMTLMAGTNDVYYQKGGSVAEAPFRLGKLIDRVRAGSPGISIVVATLVPVKNDAAAMERRNAYNEEVRSLVEARQARGEKIVLADFGPMTESMLRDTLHPNDPGYAFMADRWFEAIKAMVDKRWVIQPASVPHLPDVCATSAGGGWTELGRIAQGPINPDSSSAGVKGRVQLADFDGNGRTDYAIVTGTGAVYLWTRTADGWENRGKAADGNGVEGRGAQVRFADIDGDRDADYLVVHDDGAAEAWRNAGVAVNGGTAWQPMGVIAEGTGQGGGEEVQFADIDGDARADYLIVHDDGSIDAWVNNDVFANGRSAWKKLGQIAEGTGNPGSKVRLADLDGDAHADYLIVHSDGSTDAWLNDGVAEKLGEGWKSIGRIATGTGIEGTVQFADADTDGDADYFVIGSAGTVTLWENDDVATREDKENGFKQRGVYGNHKRDAAGNARSVRFADLDGDGDADYVLVGPEGEVEAWRNDDVATRGTNAWIKVGRVAEGVSPGTDERVVFADFNGDGRDDYLVVDGTNGRVRGWRNDGVLTKGITAWTGLGVIAQGPALAKEGEVQFADIDGDGDDDYLIVASGHSVHAWKNNGTDAPGGGGWAAQGVLASPQDPVEAGQRTLFANLDCDGRADYVLRDPGENNALYGWRNLGGFDNKWSAKRKVAYGVAMGFPVEVHLADLSGDGRDDYLVVDPTNGATRAWLNNGGNDATP